MGRPKSARQAALEARGGCRRTSHPAIAATDAAPAPAACACRDEQMNDVIGCLPAATEMIVFDMDTPMGVSTA